MQRERFQGRGPEEKSAETVAETQTAGSVQQGAEGRVRLLLPPGGRLRYRPRR